MQSNWDKKIKLNPKTNKKTPKLSKLTETSVTVFHMEDTSFVLVRIYSFTYWIWAFSFFFVISSLDCIPVTSKTTWRKCKKSNKYYFTKYLLSLRAFILASITWWSILISKTNFPLFYGWGNRCIICALLSLCWKGLSKISLGYLSFVLLSLNFTTPTPPSLLSKDRNIGLEVQVLCLDPGMSERRDGHPGPSCALS